jgi:hypothetical protein
MAVVGLSGARQLALGQDVAAALRLDGSLLVWDRAASRSPSPVQALSGLAASIAAGPDGLLVVTTTGRVVLLPKGASPAATLPEMDLPHPVIELGANASHAIALTRDGGIWSWGRNPSGALGDGSLEGAERPVEIAEAGYNWKVGRPVFDPPAEHTVSPPTVKATSATPGAQIHYRTDGQEPDSSDPAVSSGESLPITESGLVKAKATKPPMPPSNTSEAKFGTRSVRPADAPEGQSRALRNRLVRLRAPASLRTGPPPSPMTP